MAAFILENLCLGCQRCIDACSYQAINMFANVAVVNPDNCKECEECLEVCMPGAITFCADNEGISHG